MGNSIEWGKYSGRLAEAVKQLIPDTWDVTLSDVRDDRHLDAWLRVQAPDGADGLIAVEFKARLSPHFAESAWAQLKDHKADARLLVAPHIGKATRAYLREHNIQFLDFTGNVHLRLERPALYVDTTALGPEPKSAATGRRLRGAKAGRLVRHLCDHYPPFTVTELSKQLDIEIGNVSRYLDLLQSEGLIMRAPRGAVTDVAWDGVLRRWADDYRRPAEERFVDPRGLDHFVARLSNASRQYAISGVSGAAFYAPYTSETTMLCYCDDFQELSSAVGLSHSERSSNVILALPFDEWVYHDTHKIHGLTIASPSQIAVDLLVGHGREPHQAEALLRWMKDHQSDWRS